MKASFKRDGKGRRLCAARSATAVSTYCWALLATIKDKQTGGSRQPHLHHRRNGKLSGGTATRRLELPASPLAYPWAGETSMMRSASLSDRFGPRQIVSAPLDLRARLRSRASALALAAAALCCPAAPARAACTPTLNPTTGQTVTCDSNKPNPAPSGLAGHDSSPHTADNRV